MGAYVLVTNKLHKRYTHNLLNLKEQDQIGKGSEINGSAFTAVALVQSAAWCIKLSANQRLASEDLNHTSPASQLRIVFAFKSTFVGRLLSLEWLSALQEYVFYTVVFDKLSDFENCFFNAVRFWKLFFYRARKSFVIAWNDFTKEIQLRIDMALRMQPAQQCFISVWYCCLAEPPGVYKDGPWWKGLLWDGACSQTEGRPRRNREYCIEQRTAEEGIWPI